LRVLPERPELAGSCLSVGIGPVFWSTTASDPPETLRSLQSRHQDCKSRPWIRHMLSGSRCAAARRADSTCRT